MATAKDNSMHWVIGIVLLITGVLIIAALVVTYSSAQGGNVNANVNIDNDPPVIDAGNAQAFQDPADDGTNTALVGFASAPGPTVSHTLGGNTNVIVRVNVSDSNGWVSQPINLSARLMISDSGGSVLFTGFTTSEGGLDIRTEPNTGPAPCTAIANVSATERTFLCGLNMTYNQIPTTASSPYTSVLNESGEHWRVLLQASDGVATVNSFSSVHYEFAQQIGINTDSVVNLGSIATDGTPGNVQTVAVQNLGNQQIDVTSQATETVDNVAWVCTGSGNPLISDLHLSPSGEDINYNAMPALTVNGSIVNHSALDLSPASNAVSGVSTNMNMRMATAQAITPGTCTLSSIVLTAIKGF